MNYYLKNMFFELNIVYTLKIVSTWMFIQCLHGIGNIALTNDNNTVAQGNLVNQSTCPRCE